ncbi:hypothetical protein MXL54_23760 [Enterobacteriaceae bacterium G50]|nr:hypothetical protein [Enterobacteriaceae bacterium G50]
MITGIKNNCLIILLFFSLTGCDPMSGYREPPFEIRGDAELLKNMIINVKIDYNTPENIGTLSHRMQSLLYKGVIYPITFNDGDDIVHYTIYYSYKKQINTLSFDAIIPRLIMKKRESQIISVHQQGNSVYIIYHVDGNGKNISEDFLRGREVVSQDMYLKRIGNGGESYCLDCFFKLNK